MYVSQMPQPVEDDTSKALLMVLLIPIILVVIVIVVAAVLYVMVIGFGPGDFISTPVGSWQDTEALSDTSGRVTFGYMIPNVEPLDLRLNVEENGAYAGYITWTSNTASSPAALTWTGAPAGASASYFDYNPYGGEVSSGDYVTLEGLTSGSTYSFELFHIPSDSVIHMSGYDEFTTD